jgi:putative transposase
MDKFVSDLMAVCDAQSAQIAAWCLLPNHYHLLLRISDIKAYTFVLGRLHGRSSHQWNAEENRRGRQVFCHSSDRHIRSQAHFWATLNYVHHNPVRHGYVTHWTDWPWSSATDYLRNIGQSEPARIWHQYPPFDYGKNWDPPNA